MKFQFTATTKKGKKQTGVIEGDSREKVIAELKRRQLTVIFLSLKRRPRLITLPFVTTFEIMAMTKHLAIMLRSGLSISTALKTLTTQFSGKMRKTLEEILENIEGGGSLADAMAAHPRIFNDYYVNIIRSGEASGNLTENLEQLATRYSKDVEIKRKATSAAFYPAIVLSLTATLGIIVSFFVLPRLTNIFRAFDFELPLSTRILLFVSRMISDHGTLLATTIIISIPLIIFTLRSKWVRPYAHRVYLRIPMVSGLITIVNLGRFSIILGSLLDSGIPINKAIPITRDVLTNESYKRSFKRISEGIDTGKTLSSMLNEFPHLFPPFVIQMVAAGEQTGKLNEMLIYLAEFYEQELDAKLKNLSIIIEPLLLIVIGIIVAFMALAIITPVYNFLGAIG